MERPEVSPEVPEALRSWDRYRVEELIGSGGMGRVYRAWDDRLRRVVALKFLRVGDPASEARFEQEAQAQARVQHPNVCAVYEVGRFDGQPYIALQYIRGETLREAAPKLSLREKVAVLRDVSLAVHEAHMQGLVHRDVKPANILVERTEAGPLPYVTDFGLARDLRGPGVTQAGAIIGTPHYMAPEQARGEHDALDARTDVYGLGATLYELLCGIPPFSGASNLQTLYRTLNETPVPLRKVANALPSQLEAVTGKCLAKNPADRYQTARELADELQAFLDGGEVKARPETVLRRGMRALKKGRGLALATLAVLLALAVPSVLALAPREPVVVAVADFVNETRDPELDGLSGMLITALEQSEKLSVLTRSHMFDILHELGKDSVARIDEPLGREISQKAKARALLVAGIRKLDDLYVIDLKAIDPLSSAYLFAAQEQGRGKGSVPAMLDRLSRRARSELKAREGAASAQQSLSQVTTANLEAYQHYFRGEELLGQIRLREALAEFKAAVKADDSFALAYYRVAYTLEWLKEARGIAENLGHALRLIGRVPERERYLILALAAQLTPGRIQEAVEQYQKCLTRFPQEKEASFNLGDVAFHRGEFDAAIAYLELTLTLDPRHERALQHLVLSYQLTGRTEEMLRAAHAYKTRLGHDQAYATLGRAQAAAGQLSAARQTHLDAQRLFPLSAIPEVELSALDAWEGRLREAQTVAAGLLDPDRPWPQRKLGLRALAEAQTWAGQAKAAHATLEQLRLEAHEAGEPDTETIARSMQGFTAVFVQQDLRAAKEEVAKARRDNLPMPWLGFVLPYVGEFEIYGGMLRSLSDPLVDLEVRAFRRRLDGDHVEAVEDFHELAVKMQYQDLLFYEEGHSALEIHQNERAERALRKSVRAFPDATARGLSLTVAVRPRALHDLGVAQERLGQTYAALASYDRLLELWHDADPDLPDLADARTRASRLRPWPVR